MKLGLADDSGVRRSDATTVRPSRSLRRRIGVSLALMLLPLTLAGAAGAIVLTDVVDRFRAVAEEQAKELLPIAPVEARLRELENAGYDAFHTNRRDELDEIAPDVVRKLRQLTAAMDEQQEIERLRAAQGRLASALVVLRRKLAEPFPQRAEAFEGDPLAAFADRIDEAVANVRETQRLAVVESTAEVAAAQRLERWLGIVFGLLMLSSAAAALLLARRLGRQVLEPLARLQKASARVGAGEFDHRVDLRRDDELGAVGAAFDTMVEQIERAQHELRLSQRRLLESQKLEAVGQLAGGIAHDFNNLLLVVQGYTSLVAESLPADDPRVSDLAEAQAAAARAAALTKQLLTFSRRELADPVTVDVNDALRRIEAMLRRLIRTSITLELALDPAAGSTTIDPVQLEQVVLNLVLNARDAIADRGRITISSAPADVDEAFAQQHPGLRPGAYVVIGIRDDGEGMPREVADRIFEPFFTTKARGTGTGLGLAVTHGIVQQAGGYVGVYSEPGVGSSFTVYLPTAEAGVETEAVPSETASELPPLTVLVAEDEPGIRRLSSASSARRA